MKHKIKERNSFSINGRIDTHNQIKIGKKEPHHRGLSYSVCENVRKGFCSISTLNQARYQKKWWLFNAWGSSIREDRPSGLPVWPGLRTS